MAAGFYPGIRMNPMWGAAAMSLSSFTVCMNALRLNLFKMHDAAHDRRLRHPARAGESTVSGKERNGAAADNENKSMNTAVKEPQKENKMTKTLKIEGMMCGHCEAHVKKALESLEGVEQATASHEAKNAVITLSKEVDTDVLKKAVEEAGYEFKGIE
jgi:Cu2+-exporting ATPase